MIVQRHLSTGFTSVHCPRQQHFLYDPYSVISYIKCTALGIGPDLQLKMYNIVYVQNRILSSTVFNEVHDSLYQSSFQHVQYLVHYNFKSSTRLIPVRTRFSPEFRSSAELIPTQFAVQYSAICDCCMNGSHYTNTITIAIQIHIQIQIQMYRVEYSATWWLLYARRPPQVGARSRPNMPTSHNSMQYKYFYAPIQILFCFNTNLHESE